MNPCQQLIKKPYLVCIPLGGIGSRFRKMGYSLPKPLVNVMGKPILYWLLDNLNFEKVGKPTKILIPYNKELAKYRFESRLRKDYPNLNFHFIKLNRNTEGASETVFRALETLEIDDQPILSLDGDNFYTVDILNIWLNNQDSLNTVFTFEDHSQEPVFSYVKIDNSVEYQAFNINRNYRITDIVEKEKVSNLASSGAYGFNSWRELRDQCKMILDQNIRQKNEFYISTVIREMIKNQDIINHFVTNLVPVDNYVCLGTPLHVRIFCNNLPRISAITSRELIISKRICFDLDNTLVTYPIEYGDYSTVEPINHNIEFVRYLKRLGHTIIIYTARRMKSCGGNRGAVMANVGKITFETLERFEIPYDEIYFGKPYADFYVDDLMISSYSNLEKELGFYSSLIEPRNFNRLQTGSIQSYRKSSNKDLSGEIYYYNNIPNDIKDMFPIMFNYDQNGNTFYEIEKINGIPVSKLYLSEELTTTQLGYIISSLKRIHSAKSTISSEGINIYANYATKLKERYQSNQKVYQSLGNGEKIEQKYQEIMRKLEEYEKEGKGKLGVIHGDPVFTNILINSLGKIKMIDMRGKLGSEMSIYGDIYYDFAKVYQSLIGYDEILTNGCLSIGESYRNEMLACFEGMFNEEEMVWIKLLTNSLLFSLIPLHTDFDKMNEFSRL